MATNFWKARPGPDEVARLRRAVADYAACNGMPTEQVRDVALAVSEVVTNAVVHAFVGCDPDDGTITVTATVNGGEVTVRVIDDGAGLKPRLDSPGAGLGLSIAGRLARRMEVEQPACGGTEVRMSFALTA